MSEDIQRLHATIHGWVQGVGFRYFVAEQARQFELTGWVRNRYERTVETVAEGRKADLEGFLTALGRGPSASKVTRVDSSWHEATGEFSTFKIRMTS